MLMSQMSNKQAKGGDSFNYSQQQQQHYKKPKHMDQRNPNDYSRDDASRMSYTAPDNNTSWVPHSASYEYKKPDRREDEFSRHSDAPAGNFYSSGNKDNQQYYHHREQYYPTTSSVNPSPHTTNQNPIKHETQDYPYSTHNRNSYTTNFPPDQRIGDGQQQFSQSHNSSFTPHHPPPPRYTPPPYQYPMPHQSSHPNFFQPSHSFPPASCQNCGSYNNHQHCHNPHSTSPPPPILPPHKTLIAINVNDVLFGRGGESNNHEGNIKYRNLVKIHQRAYLATTRKKEKTRISRLIVDTVRQEGGRFLKKDADGKWFEVEEKRAMLKTSQALREDAPNIRPEMMKSGGGM